MSDDLSAAASALESWCYSPDFECYDDEEEVVRAPGEVFVRPFGYVLAFKDRAACLKWNAHNDAIDALEAPWFDHYAFPEYNECLSGVRAILDPQNAYRVEEQERARKALAILLRAAFIGDHDLTDEEFASDHWQTLFVLTYPEARA